MSFPVEMSCPVETVFWALYNGCKFTECCSASVFDCFSPFSAYESSMEALQQPSIRVIAVIAEGVPEADTKQLIAYATRHNKIVVGPATVGGLQVGF